MRFHTQLELRVRYMAPARDCRRVLRVLPLHRGGQLIAAERWQSAPHAETELEKRDEVGNRRLLLHHRGIESGWDFGLEFEAQTTGAPLLDFTPDLARWKMPSRAVSFDAPLQSLARGARELAPLERAAHFDRFCHAHLEYDARTDAFPLPAGQIWARRRGNCADFAHLFLALCRASGLMARYVAGFSAGEGQMHAWAEVWAENHWHPFDPTQGASRAVRALPHVAVAVGRDYHDCAPHTGQFRGGAGAELELWCRTRRVEGERA